MSGLHLRRMYGLFSFCQRVNRASNILEKTYSNVTSDRRAGRGGNLVCVFRENFITHYPGSARSVARIERNKKVG